MAQANLKQGQAEYGLALCIGFADAAAVKAHVGQVVCETHWVEVSQERINLFAKATGDYQWIHVDEARCARESPYGRTIAHGFLTLSMLGEFYEAYLSQALPFCHMGLNYGLNRLRFTQPVLSGSRVRSRLALKQVDDVAGGLQLSFDVTVDIEGNPKPALVAETIVRRLWA